MRILSVTSVRNEGLYLLEWIAHHKAAGVSDFLIYSNDCDDGTNRMLDLLAQAGIITHVPQMREKGKSIQWQALRAAWKHPLRKLADWILVSDVDEFVNVKTGDRTLTQLIAGLDSEIDAIALKWRLFGHNDVTQIVDAPVTEQFTRAIPPDTEFPIAASLFKCLFRTKGPFNMLGVHRPRQKNPEKAGLPVFADGSGQRLPDSFASQGKRLSLYDYGARRDLVEMNHYAVRSAAGFLVKRARGLPNRAHKAVDLAYWVERNFNTAEATSIRAMAPATARVLADLMALPGLAECHATAVSWHQAKFTELVRMPDNQVLLTQILTAGSSDILPKKLQQQLIKWYQQAHRSKNEKPD